MKPRLLSSILVVLFLMGFSGYGYSQTNCVTSTSVTYSPLPTNGTYPPGQLVEICITVNGYSQASAEWLDGVALNLPPGNPWVLPPVTVGPITTTGGTVGVWGWYASVTGTASGQTYGPGFFCDLNGDGNPGNDFGDNCGTNCSWTFCFTLQVSPSATPGASLTFGTLVLGDYDAGSWGGNGCITNTISTLPGVTVGGGSCVDPQMTLAGTQVACVGVNDGTITASLANPGANPTWEYSLNGGAFQASPTFTGLAAGNYTITVENDSNCTYTQNITLANHNPQLTTTVVGESCQGMNNGSVTVNVGNPSTYTWQFAANGGGFQASNIFSSLDSGNYAIVVQSNVGCAYNLNATVLVPPALTVSAPNDTTVCPTTSASLVAVAGGGTPSVGVGTYTYVWTLNGFVVGNAASLPLNGLPVALNTYVVTVIDGCSPDVTDTVLVNVPLTISVSTNNDTTICEGQSVTLDAIVSGSGVVLGYDWQFGGASIGSSASITVSPTAVGPNKYYVYVNDSCATLVDSVTIFVDPAPSSAFSMDEAACVGDPVDVFFQGAPIIGLAYEWVFGGNATPTAAFGPTDKLVTWNSPGIKTATLTAYNATCTTTTTLNINITTQPVVNAGPDLTICALDSLTLLGTTNQASLAGCTITWTDLGGGAPLTGSLNPVVTPATSTSYELVVICGSCISLPDTVNITVQDRPVVTVANADVAFCAGDTGVVVSGSATGGTGSGTYTFHWEPTQGLADAFSASTTASPTVTTVYELYATDANNCVSDPGIVTVTVHELPVPNAGTDQYTCNQTPVQLQGSATGGSGNYGFSWTPTAHLDNPTSATPNATPDTSIVYTLTVTDITTGCVNTLSDPLSQVTVYIVSPLTADAGPAQVTICEGDSALIGHPTLGTIPGITYAWSPGTGLADANSGYTLASPSTTTVYTLDQSQGACAGLPDQITVNVLPTPIINLANPQGPYCTGEQFVPDYQLIATVAPPITFQWWIGTDLQPASVSPQPIFTADTSFVLSVRVTNSNGCFGEASSPVVVTPVPALSAGPDQSYCVTALTTGVQLAANFAGTNAVWLAPLNLSIPDPIVNPTETQDYILRGVYGNNCEVMDTVTVFVLPGLVPSISASDTVVCSGTPVLLTATGGVGAATYSWSPVAGLDNPTGASVLANPKAVSFADTLTYTVTVSEGGCTADTSITLVVYPTPVVSFLPSALNVCLPDSAVRFMNTTQNATVYAWEFGDGGTDSTAQPSHAYATSGTYNVTLTAWSDDLRTCFAQATYPTPITVNDSVVAQMVSSHGPTDTVWLPNGTVQFVDQSTGSTASFWDFGDGMNGSGNPASHNYEAPGDYTVTLIAMNDGGCRDTVTYGPVLVRQEILVPIPNVFTPNGDGFNDDFHIDYSGTQPFRLTITDRWGVHVFDATTPIQPWTATDAPAGVYFYRVKIGDRVLVGSVTLVR